MWNKIKHYFYWKFKAKPSGLEPTPEDERDFQTGIFGWGKYEPKHDRHIIETKSIKDQTPFNTCQWNATIVQKEKDENCRLSVRMMVTIGRALGLISGDGFSNLRSGQKVLALWGALKEGEVIEKNTDWYTYSKQYNPSLFKDRLAKHKISSYWSVSSRNDVLKLLDEGRIIATGMKWFSGFNMGGGFRAPWLITKQLGYYVGGHAVVIIGYDLNYEGRKVYIMQNSYGSGWGDNGRFYVDMDYLDRDNYGYYTNIDEIDKELGQFLVTYDGKNVKGDKSSGIFHIQKGQKKPYTSWVSYLSWNGKQRGFTEVKQELIDKVEEGDIMDLKKSVYWEFLQDVKKSDQLEYLLELLNKEN